MILSGVFGREEKTLAIDELEKIKLSERIDGYGTITFYTEYSWYDRLGLQANWKPVAPEFDIIQNPAEVYRIIMAQRTTPNPDA